jgi:hypothetical protein
MPPPPQRTPKAQKRCLPDIPEEDELTGSQCPKFEDPDLLVIKVSPGGGSPQVEVQLGQGG